jgi:hypothetical protein
MYARIIISHPEPVDSACGQPMEKTALQRTHTESFTNTVRQLFWELTAADLTAGQVVDLLLCLDELGFSDKSDSPFTT